MAASTLPFRPSKKLASVVVPRPEDRWLAAFSGRGARNATALVLLASILGHSLFVALTLFGGKAATPVEREVSVELVSEIPQPAKQERTAAGPASNEANQGKGTAEAQPQKTPDKQAQEAAAPRPEAAAPKPEMAAPKPEPAPPSPAPPPVTPPAKQTSAPPAAQKAATPAAQNQKPQPEPAQSEAARIDAAARERAAAEREAEQTKSDLKSLESELAALKAEQASLKQEAAPRTAPAESGIASKMASLGIGSLPGSEEAVALPATTSDGEGDQVDYKAIVFSQLAKAKRIGREMGIPGTAGIHFEIDDSGRLVSVAVASSSGIKQLDDEALAIVTKAAPFPPPPKGARRSYSANVSFIAERGR